MKRNTLMFAALLLAGMLSAGCAEKKEEQIITTQESSEGSEDKVREEASETEEDPEIDEVKEEAEEDTEEKKEIALPEEEERITDYTSVTGLQLEPGSNIAVVVKSTKAGYWDAVKQGITQAVDDLNKELGYTAEEDKITFTYDGCDDEDNVTEQVNTLDAVIDTNPAFICLSAVDMNSCYAQLEAAQENGIPVIVLDSGVQANEMIHAVCATDNYEAGREAARRLCERIEAEGKVAIMAHQSTTETSKKRVEGFQDEIKENYPEVEIVHVSYEPAKEGDASIEEQLKASMVLFPDMKGYFCTDEQISEQALKIVGEYKERDVQIVGFDLGNIQLEAIRNGTEAGVISQNPYGMGYVTVVAGVRAVMGMENDDFINSGYLWLDQENIDLEENKKYIYE